VEMGVREAGDDGPPPEIDDLRLLSDEPRDILVPPPTTILLPFTATASATVSSGSTVTIFPFLRTRSVLNTSSII